MENSKSINVMFGALEARSSKPSVEVLKKDAQGIAVLVEQLVSGDHVLDIVKRAFKDVSQLSIANMAHCILLCRAVELAMERTGRDGLTGRGSEGGHELGRALHQLNLRQRVAIVASQRGWSLDDVAAALKVDLKTAKALQREAIINLKLLRTGKTDPIEG